jgi:hypothetical protein
MYACAFPCVGSVAPHAIFGEKVSRYVGRYIHTCTYVPTMQATCGGARREGERVCVCLVYEHMCECEVRSSSIDQSPIRRSPDGLVGYVSLDIIRLIHPNVCY